jgi:hypothetical protein
MSTEPDDDLDRLLRAAGPPLADDGFSDRVVARLPARAPTRVRGAILGVASACAAAVLVASPAAPALTRAVAPLFAAGVVPASAVLAFVAFVGATLATALYAARPD